MNNNWNRGQNNSRGRGFSGHSNGRLPPLPSHFQNSGQLSQSFPYQGTYGGASFTYQRGRGGGHRPLPNGSTQDGSRAYEQHPYPRGLRPTGPLNQGATNWPPANSNLDSAYKRFDCDGQRLPVGRAAPSGHPHNDASMGPGLLNVVPNGSTPHPQPRNHSRHDPSQNVPPPNDTPSLTNEAVKPRRRIGKELGFKGRIESKPADAKIATNTPTSHSAPAISDDGTRRTDDCRPKLLRETKSEACEPLENVRPKPQQDSDKELVPVDGAPSLAAGERPTSEPVETKLAARFIPKEASTTCITEEPERVKQEAPAGETELTDAAVPSTALLTNGRGASTVDHGPDPANTATLSPTSALETCVPHNEATAVVTFAHILDALFPMQRPEPSTDTHSPHRDSQQNRVEATPSQSVTSCQSVLRREDSFLNTSISPSQGSDPSTLCGVDFPEHEITLDVKRELAEQPLQFDVGNESQPMSCTGAQEISAFAPGSMSDTQVARTESFPEDVPNVSTCPERSPMIAQTIDTNASASDGQAVVLHAQRELVGHGCPSDVQEAGPTPHPPPSQEQTPNVKVESLDVVIPGQNATLKTMSKGKAALDRMKARGGAKSKFIRERVPGYLGLQRRPLQPKAEPSDIVEIPPAPGSLACVKPEPESQASPSLSVSNIAADKVAEDLTQDLPAELLAQVDPRHESPCHTLPIEEKLKTEEDMVLGDNLPGLLQLEVMSAPLKRSATIDLFPSTKRTKRRKSDLDVPAQKPGWFVRPYAKQPACQPITKSTRNPRHWFSSPEVMRTSGFCRIGEGVTESATGDAIVVVGNEHGIKLERDQGESNEGWKLHIRRGYRRTLDSWEPAPSLQPMQPGNFHPYPPYPIPLGPVTSYSLAYMPSQSSMGRPFQPATPLGMSAQDFSTLLPLPEFKDENSAPCLPTLQMQEQAYGAVCKQVHRPPELTSLFEAFDVGLPIVVVADSRDAGLGVGEEIGPAVLGWFEIISMDEKVEGSEMYEWCFQLKWKAGENEERPWWGDGAQGEQGANVESDILPPSFYGDRRADKLAWHCVRCGKVNMQTTFRHLKCSSSFCGKHTSEALSPLVLSDVVRNPQDKLPTAKPHPYTPGATETCWDDGMKTFEYAAAGTKVSVHHIFTGNMPALQEDADVVWRNLQREVVLEFHEHYYRNYFTLAMEVLPQSVKDAVAWAEDVIKTYGEAAVEDSFVTLEVLAWWKESKRRVSRRLPAQRRPVVLVCLGSALTLTLSGVTNNDPLRGSIQSSNQQNGIQRPPDYVVGMVHGDVLFLSGDDFEYHMKRSGGGMLLVFGSVPASASALRSTIVS